MSRSLAAVAIALGALGFAAPPASAASVIRESPGSFFTLSVDGGPAANGLTISYEPATQRLRFAEPGISEVSASCIDLGDTIDCPLPPPQPDPVVATVQVGLGPGDDTVSVAGSVPATTTTGIAGDAGADAIFGGPGSEVVDTGPGADTFLGGPGVDSVSYARRSTPVFARLDGSATSGNEEDGPAGARDTLGPDVEGLTGGNAPDRLTGSPFANEIRGGKGADLLFGGPGADELLGGSGSDSMFGQAGRDVLEGEGLRDVYLGGKGIDLLRARNGAQDILLDCGPGNDRRERALTDPKDPEPKRC